MTLDDRAMINLAGKADSIIEALTKTGVAIVGYNASKHWTGALTALVSLKLAQGGNLAAGVAGVGVLSLLGLANIVRAAATPGENGFTPSQSYTPTIYPIAYTG